VSGYTIIRADDLKSAVTVAKGCPGLQHGGGQGSGSARTFVSRLIDRVIAC